MPYWLRLTRSGNTFTDDSGQYARATVGVVVESVNDPPQALADVAYTDPGTAVVTVGVGTDVLLARNNQASFFS